MIYQGEELGLTQVDIPFDRIQDPEAKNNWPQTLGRDGARTPMPWCQSDVGGGFTGSEPWLPLPREHRALAVDVQSPDPDSVLSFFRAAIGFRGSSDALRRGDLRFLDGYGDLLVFERRSGEESALCAFNLTDREIRWNAPRRALADHQMRVGCEPLDRACPDLLPPGSGYVGVFGDPDDRS